MIVQTSIEEREEVQAEHSDKSYRNGIVKNASLMDFRGSISSSTLFPLIPTYRISTHRLRFRKIKSTNPLLRSSKV